MTNQPQSKLSRRDALKILAAATGAVALANIPSKWKRPELAAGVLPAHAQTSIVPPVVPVLPTVTTDSITVPSFGIPMANFSGTVTSEGSSPVTVRGFVWSASPNPTLPSISSAVASGGGLGSFSVLNQTVLPAGTYYGRAYATSGVGTAYGSDIQFTTNVCLAEGTLVTLANGAVKKIEDVESSDWLAVWNFDEGKFDAAQPLWIKKAETTDRYNLLEFSDGSSLKTISQHRIFNKEKGMFTYPMTDDTPIGTTTFNINGEEVTLTHKQVVNEQVRYYNVITNHHMSLFANGILTSCRYNNIYPIVDMKFVKEERKAIPQEAYEVDSRYYEGLRLAEQTIPVADTIAYINRLEALKSQDWTDLDSIYSENKVEALAV